MSTITAETLSQIINEGHTNYRKMTAADLGLSLRQWDPEWLAGMYGPCPARVWEIGNDAPYSFWLGADA